jgi:hypothetical protein
VTTATGGISLSTGEYQSTLGSGGYVATYEDGLGSVVCMEQNAICAKGTTVAQNASGTAWGVGIQINLNQAKASGSAAMTYAVSTSSTGLTYAFATLPPRAMINVSLGNGQSYTDEYCFLPTTASGTIPWTSFHQTCTTYPGPALVGPPQNVTAIDVQVGVAQTAGSFDFCVSQLHF